jgi:hypothetical protein
MEVRAFSSVTDLLTHAGLARMRNTRKDKLCVSIVKRDKRMQDAGRYPAAEHLHA